MLHVFGFRLFKSFRDTQNKIQNPYLGLQSLNYLGPALLLNPISYPFLSIRSANSSLRAFAPTVPSA